MDSRYAKAMVQLIGGTRPALDVIALKPTSCEVVGEVPKMLQGLAERFQVRMGRLHPRDKGQVALAHLCSAVHLLIRQDRCRLVNQSVGLLERRPKGRGGLQAFGQELLPLLQGWGPSFFPWTRARESLT